MTSRPLSSTIFGRLSIALIALIALGIPALIPAGQTARREPQAIWTPEKPLSSEQGGRVPASPEATTVSEAVKESASKYRPYPKLVKRIKTTDRVVFITIDDGWYRDWRLVKLLRNEGFPITVFLTEAASRDHRSSYFRSLASAGADIQNHTILHPDLAKLSYKDVKHEICEASTRLKKRFGIDRPTMIRPPYGSWNKAVVRVMRKCGIHHLVMWNAEVANRRLITREGGRLEPGDIVLLHFRRELREDLEALRKQMRAQKLKPADLRDYLPS